MSKVWIKWALISVVAMGALGCVAQKQFDDEKTALRLSEEQKVKLRNDLEEALSRVRALQEAQKMQDPDMLSKLEQAMSDRDKALKALGEAEDRLRAAGQQVALSTQVTSALTDLVASNPGLMEFDPKLGMIKFHSDMTFALGSTEVRPEARASLDKLAEILKSPMAAQYEARIVGHTDNVRVAKPSTKVRFPDNWYLSAGRAIAVEEILQNDGVPPVRLGIAGYGQYRPVVANISKGAEANRRVEIYLFPSTYNGMGTTEDATEAPEKTAPAAAPKPMPAPSEPPENFK